MSYNFLAISILFLLPGAVIFFCRRDLRTVIRRVVPLSLPFACTEFLFYPSYWEPRFLFDLADRIGFGIEDFIFVAGLAAFTTTAYAFFSGRRYRSLGTSSMSSVIARCGMLFGATAVLVTVAALSGVPMIYGSCAIMMLVAAAMLLLRRDLIIPACLGAVCSTATYYMLCLLCLLLMPGLFQTVWHAERFLNIPVAGVPFEELLYGFSSGFCATAVYPYLFSQAFAACAENTQA